MNKTNLKTLLSAPGAKIIIPMFQRDYAQGRPDKGSTNVRREFIKALLFGVQADGLNLDFIYGAGTGDTLIPLDGQQRLTTLWLLYWLASRRERINHDQAAWLQGFTYETRTSTKRFCHELASYWPDKFDNKPSKIIRDDANWYLDDYDDDASASAMLRMLDDLSNAFFPEGKQPVVEKLWQGLDKITFFCESIEDLGLTDEIYIKMNSRGKALTPYEHFKARLDQATGGKLTAELDGKYTDYMWRLGINEGDDVPNVDERLLSFIRNIARLINFSTSSADISPDTSDYDLVGTLWTGDNITILIRAFEALVTTDSQDVAAVANAVDEDDYIPLATKRPLPMTGLLFFYGALTYLENISTITSNEFARRFRQLRNLIRNSRVEVRADRMATLLCETEALILKGEINTASASFNLIQKQEEVEKLRWIDANPERETELAEVENHPLLKGSVGTIGLDGLHLHNAFCKVFDNIDFPDQRDTRALLTRALLALGDSEHTETYYRNSIGGGLDKGKYSSWATYLFPDTSNNQQQNKANAVRALLQRIDDNAGMTLPQILAGIIDEYIATNQRYDRRYYLIRYQEPVARCRYGKLKPKYIVMSSEMYPSAFCWPVHQLALLEAIRKHYPDIAIYITNDGNGILYFTDYTTRIAVTEEGFATVNEAGKQIKQWSIARDDNGCDICDRVEYAVQTILPEILND